MINYTSKINFIDNINVLIESLTIVSPIQLSYIDLLVAKMLSTNQVQQSLQTMLLKMLQHQ